jgi:hypothetical protein
MNKRSTTDVKWDKQGNYIQHSEHNRTEMKNLLDSVGPGFCLAKWTQVTMHLGSGVTHSCHHPRAHKIPLEEIEKDPGALHNTIYKKERRKEMLNGERPAECDFCWRIEDNTGQISDRVLKSLDPYSFSDYDKISSMTGDEAPYPRYVEVSFSNICNFKCAYCGPGFSSKWVEEIKQHGGYEVNGHYPYNSISHDEPQYLNREDNPYTNAFWKWLPDALPHMHTLRITGGEPLMSKHTMKVLDYLLDHPSPDLEVAMNSNGCPPDKLWKQFTKKVNELIEKNCIKKFTLFISAEGVGKQSEYSRFGMDWEKFESNVKYFLENTEKTRVTFMAAFNLFSIPTFIEFLEMVLSLKKRYNSHGYYEWLDQAGIDLHNTLNLGLTDYTIDEKFTTSKRGQSRIGIDIPYVRNPKFLDVKLITRELIDTHLIKCVDFMYANACDEWNGDTGFQHYESLKLKRIVLDIISTCKDGDDQDKTSTNPSIGLERSNFYNFVNEYDRRRDTDFLKTFPEMADFYKLCELEHIKRDQ